MQTAAIDEKAAAGEQGFIRNRKTDDPQGQQPEDGEIAVGRNPLEDGAFQPAMIARRARLYGRRNMQRAAIGIRPHSGWGALVVVAGDKGAIDVVLRKRVVITAPDIKGASQPYHFAQGQNLTEAERYLAECAAASEQLAWEALGETIEEARSRKKVVTGCAILLAAGRSQPELPKILASHPLIHTAEGEFFRQSFRRAGERLKLEVTGIRERDLDERAREKFGAETDSVRREIAGLGSSLGPPWTSDQKNACLAALLVLKNLGHG